MGSPSKEARLLLALKAIQNNKHLKIYAAAKLYNVLVTTLRRRRADKPARRDTTPNSRRLTDSEEKAIIQYVTVRTQGGHTTITPARVGK
jgi:hypothetical protein